MYVEAQELLLAHGGVLISDEELAAINCPTLIMHGTRDRIVPVALRTDPARKIHKSRLHLFEAGHPAHLRYPQNIRRWFWNSCTRIPHQIP